MSSENLKIFVRYFSLFLINISSDKASKLRPGSVQNDPSSARLDLPQLQNKRFDHRRPIPPSRVFRKRLKKAKKIKHNKNKKNYLEFIFLLFEKIC